MPPKLVRITINVIDPFVKVLEYGEASDITPEEKVELKELADILVEYTDFTTADAVEEDERKQLMQQKKRYEELKVIGQGKRINWTMQDNSDLNSLLVIMRGDFLPVYCENIPPEFINRMLDPIVNVHVKTEAAPIPARSEVKVEESITPTPTTQPSAVNPVTIVQKVLDSIKAEPTMSQNQGLPWLAEKVNDGYHGLVYVSAEAPGGQSSLAGIVYAWPVKYLKDDWTPVNEAFKKIFGEKLSWVRTDPGKWSHWEVKFG